MKKKGRNLTARASKLRRQPVTGVSAVHAHEDKLAEELEAEGVKYCHLKKWKIRKSRRCMNFI